MPQPILKIKTSRQLMREMASTNTHALALALLVVVGAQLLGDHKVSAQCGGSIIDIQTQCYQFVKKEGERIPPSPGCCQAVTKLNIPCVCQFVTPTVEAMVSMEKVVYVARTCGITIQPGMKCGSYTVPPPV